jgi:hypothetical protein
MDKSEKLITLNTQDTGRRQQNRKKQRNTRHKKSKKISHMGLTQTRFNLGVCEAGIASYKTPAMLRI